MKQQESMTTAAEETTTVEREIGKLPPRSPSMKIIVADDSLALSPGDPAVEVEANIEATAGTAEGDEDEEEEEEDKKEEVQREEDEGMNVDTTVSATANEGEGEVPVVTPGSTTAGADAVTHEARESPTETKDDEEKLEEEEEEEATEGADVPSTPLAPVIKVGEAAQTVCDSFGVSMLPDDFVTPELLENCKVKDETLWERYLDARRCLADDCAEKAAKAKEVSEEGKSGDDETPSKDESQAYLAELKEKFESQWEASILGSFLNKHTYQRSARVSISDGKLEDATIVSTIFSPYLFPRAVQLCHRYFRRSKQFYCTWHVQFVSLEIYNGAEDLLRYYWKPLLSEMMEICSNGYLENPTTEIDWVAVEDIRASTFTPSIVRKMRKWLFGHFNSYQFFNDIDLVRYVLGSCGAVEPSLTTLHGDIGHHWKASPAQAEDMQIYGTIKDAEVEKAVKIGSTWLEFHSRMATNSLRAIDQWYEPYDQRYHKAKWGKDVMDYRYQETGYYEEDDKIRDQPWKVWDRSVRGIHGNQTVQGNVISLIGSL